MIIDSSGLLFILLLLSVKFGTCSMFKPSVATQALKGEEQKLLVSNSE